MIMPNFTRWMGSHRDVRLLQTVTLLRSVGQGIALVDMSLLLRELGWSGGAIGALLAAAGIVKTAATLLAGELNALLGAKRFLLLLELITAFAALAVSLTTHTVALDIAIVSAGLGSGHSGSGGPASPIERAWLAAYARYDSSRLFHANALLGYLGMGIGCLLGCLPSWYGSLLAGPDAYRPAFALIALSAAGGAALLLRISGGKRKPRPKPAEAPEAAEAVQRAAVTEHGAAIERSAAAGRGVTAERGAATAAVRGTGAEQSAVAERTAAAKPSAKAERTAAAKPSAEAERTAAAKPSAEAERTAAVKPSAEAERTAAVKPSAEAERTAAAKPSAEAERTAAAKPSAEAERTAAAKPSAEAERTAAVSGGRSGRAGEGMKLLLLALSLAAVLGIAFVLRRLGLREAALYVPIAVFLAILAVTAWRRLRTGQSTETKEQRLEELRHFAYMLGTVTAALSCTMTSYWFSVRFGASPGAIGAVMGLSYIAAGWLSFRIGAGADKDGALRSVTFMQLLSIVLLLAMPWTTSFALAAVLEIGCTACSLGTRGNRTALLMEDKSRGRGKRSLFSKINYLLIRTGAVLWPGAFGGLIEAGHFASPFLITAALQSAAAWLYARVHRAPKDISGGHDAR